VGSPRWKEERKKGGGRKLVDGTTGEISQILFLHHHSAGLTFQYSFYEETEERKMGEKREKRRGGA